MSKAINITEAVPSRQIRNQKKEKTMTNNVPRVCVERIINDKTKIE